MSKLILASKSQARAHMLKQAGVEVTLMGAEIDERMVEAQYMPLSDTQTHPNGGLALHLAMAKAQDVCLSSSNDDLVIGADQILTFEGEILHKPKNLDELKQRWSLLSGKSHFLTSAAAIVQNSDEGVEVKWSAIQSAKLTMRAPSQAYFDRMIETHGEELLGSVGGYRVEDSTLQMFEKIDGDYFAILGMPLLPLLQGLRDLGALQD